MAGGSLFTNPKVLGIGAVALVAIAAAGFWALSGSDETGPTPEPVAGTSAPAASDGAVVEESVLQTEVVIPETASLDELIDEARALAAAGQLFAPEGNNAIELYLSALDVAPGDPVAQQGLDEAVDRSLAMAESALLERRANEALAAIEGVELGSPRNPRLPFLWAQLTQIQLRQSIDSARAAIREGRYEDAQTALAAAKSLGVADTTDLCPDTAEGAKVDALGCDDAARIVLRGVNFKTDSDELTAESLAILDGVSATLSANPDIRVMVAGHTDSDGEDAYNKDLSQRRAQAVVDVLVNQYGIDAARLQPKGYGESQPAARNDTEEGRAQNRRVMATLEVEYEE